VAKRLEPYVAARERELCGAVVSSAQELIALITANSIVSKDIKTAIEKIEAAIEALDREAGRKIINKGITS
jgi:hypothetical protein